MHSLWCTLRATMVSTIPSSRSLNTPNGSPHNSQHVGEEQSNHHARFTSMLQLSNELGEEIEHGPIIRASCVNRDNSAAMSTITHHLD